MLTEICSSLKKFPEFAGIIYRNFATLNKGMYIDILHSFREAVRRKFSENGEQTVGLELTQASDLQCVNKFKFIIFTSLGSRLTFFSVTEFWIEQITCNNGSCCNTWCVQVLRSPKEAFAAAMQSWRESCEKCVCLQGDYVEK